MPPGIAMTRIATVKRFKTYPRREKAHSVIDRSRLAQSGKRKQIADPGGIGWEIEQEVQVCPAYASGLHSGE